MSSKWENKHEDWARDRSRTQSRSSSRSNRVGGDRRDRHDRYDRHQIDRERNNKHREERNKERRRDESIDRSRRERSPHSGRDRSRSKSPERPNYGRSGLLAKETMKTATGKVLKYNEPADSCEPPKDRKYLLYIFSQEDPEKIVDTIKLSRRSFYLVGRDSHLADIPLPAGSACSSQHAAFQYRMIVKRDRYGEKTEQIKLYVIDLDSTNGTVLNGKEIPKSRYVEIIDKDVLKFADSAEMVVMVDG